MATLKEFEEALRQAGMSNALALLEDLKKRDRAARAIAPARRVVGRKMTAELARSILELHATTGMTQQEIAFKLGVNQGRVNEVVKRGKWLSADPNASEALTRDKAINRLTQRARARRATRAETSGPNSDRPRPVPVGAGSARTIRPGMAAPSSLATAPRPAPLKPMTLPLRRPSAKPRVISAQLAFLEFEG